MKKRVLCFLMCLVMCLMLLPLSAFAGDSDVVNVPDTAFKQYLNKLLGHAADADITEADMKKITRIDYSGQYGSLTDLEGIQYCTGLTFFRINGGGTPDCHQLANCKKITFLAIMSSRLEDISFVSGLTEITYLDLYNCEISDISPIKNLTKLTVLDIMRNHVLDMSAVSGVLRNMTHLYGLNESASITLDCTKEENGYCIVSNPVVGIDAAPVAPATVRGCEYDAASNTFRVPSGTTGFSFTTSQKTIANSGDFQNYFNTSVTVSINHPPKTGSLTVSEKLDGNSVEPDKTFSFVITLSDKTINGIFGGVEFTDGTASVTLGNEESITIDGLPDQVGFTVVEEDPGEYICSAPDGISGTIDYLTPATAAFINTRNVFYHVYYQIEGDAVYGTPDDAPTIIDSKDYAPNEAVTVAAAPQSSQDYGIDSGTGESISGEWTFTPWDKTDFLITEDTTINGAWTFNPAPVPEPDPDPEQKPAEPEKEEPIVPEEDEPIVPEKEEPIVPETGDGTDVVLLAVLISVCAAAFTGLTVYGTKKEN